MVSSWGNYPKVNHCQHKIVRWRDQVDLFSQLPVLPYGTGRSYGDSCLNENGVVLDTKFLNHFIQFDAENGVLQCEAGVTLEAILQFANSRGWMLPVLPGTKLISAGGAIANDVHGKNHHSMGTFGRHVKSFELLRSDGECMLCSSTENENMFKATIGGLGLTGLILTVELQLVPLANEYLSVKTTPFQNLEAFMEVNELAEDQYEYTSAWLDCQSAGKNFGRGIYYAANFCDVVRAQDKQVNSKRPKTVPFNFPSFTLNKFSIKCFNAWYFKRQSQQADSELQEHYAKQLFPLDNLKQWNLIYGKRGFVQYQSVIPFENGLKNLTNMLETIVQSGQGSFLSVLKTFGDAVSPGLMSFPMPGITLALDFAFQGERTLGLLNKLDDIVMQAGGRVYPAKDARMSAKAFQHYFPQLEQFKSYIDPGFSSSFWRRVTEVL